MKEKIQRVFLFLKQKFLQPLGKRIYKILGFFWHKSPRILTTNTTVLKVKDFIKKENKTRRDWVIIIIVTLVLLWIIWGFVVPKQKGPTYTFAKVEQGKIISSVSVTGAVTSKQQKVLTFPTSGIVKNVYVQVGDTVKQHDFLAELDTTSYQAQLKQAKGSLMVAEANLRKIKKGLDINVQQQNVKNAELAFEIAQTNYDTTTKTGEQNLQQAQLSAESSNIALANAQIGMENTEKDSAEAVAVAQLQEENAEDQYEAAKDAYERGTGSDTAKDAARSAWEIAIEQKVQSELGRQTQLDTALGQITSTNIQSQQAVSSLTSTEVQVQNSQITAEKQIAQAEVGIGLAQAQYQQVVGNRTDDIKAYEGQVLQAEGAMDSAQDVVNKAKLTAPFAGTITGIAVEEGEFFSAALGSFLEIANLDLLQIEVNISETDIVDVASGQRVILNFDALAGEEFEGKVEKVDPGPTVIQGVVNYKVTISFLQDSRIRLGMTVNLDIITAEKEDSLYVPFRAIEEKDSHQFVKVKRNGHILRQEVKTGIQSDTDIEILEGLQQGDTIAY